MIVVETSAEENEHKEHKRRALHLLSLPSGLAFSSFPHLSPITHFTIQLYAGFIVFLYGDTSQRGFSHNVRKAEHIRNNEERAFSRHDEQIAPRGHTYDAA